MLDHRLCIAPMLDWSDRFFRYFVRLITRRSLLYTEMVTCAALLHGESERFLEFDASEHPVALQLGGSSPPDLARCSRMGAARGYDEINLNVGCPSDRVQSGRFGACLMAEPRLVAECITAMIDACDRPVSVKHRTGIDHLDSQQALWDFVGTISEAGCRTFIVHARKAWLQGLSPKQNREVPPLDYTRVHRLKQDFPDLEIVINGGITSLEMCEQQLKSVDGVMIGREAYHNPWMLAEADRRLFQDSSATVATSRHDIVRRMLPFVENELARGTPLGRITRHMLGLFHGRPGARAWRRHLSEHSWRRNAGCGVIVDAAAKVPETNSTTAKKV